MNPFDIISIISEHKPYTWSDEMEKDYAPYMINKGLGQFADTVLIANQMNRMSSLDKKLQMDFLYGTVRKGKRFSKWAKAPKDELAEVLVEVFGYSRQYAGTVVDMFSEEQMLELKSRLNKGGMA